MAPALDQAARALLDAAGSGAGSGPVAPDSQGAPKDAREILLAPINAANAKVRETAKWMATSFAAIGGVLVGGLGLSSLGKLTASTPDERVAAAVAGLVLALSGIVLGLWFAARVLSPFLNTFATADCHPAVTRDVLGDREAIGLDYQELKAGYEKARQALRTAKADEVGAEALAGAEARLARWERSKVLALSLIGSRRLAIRFDQARVAIAVGFVLAAAGVGLFAWGANPPSAASDAPVALSQAPTRLSVQLTAAGVAALRHARRCRHSRLTALAIGGSSAAPEVVTVPARGCRSVRFTLSSRLGTPVAAG